ncbi:MAG: antitoxin family protein [Chloroflexota bacterium]
MTTTLRAIFDGQVFRPIAPVELEPDTRYVLTVEREAEAGDATDEAVYPLTALRRLATDMGVTDFSARHASYAHGRLDEDVRAP